MLGGRRPYIARLYDRSLYCSRVTYSYGTVWKEGGGIRVLGG